MTTEEIQQHINGVLEKHFTGLTAQSGEMMTSEGGDGRFFGKPVLLIAFVKGRLKPARVPSRSITNTKAPHPN